MAKRMTFKERLLSIVLCVATLVAYIPLPVLAEVADTTVVTVTTANGVTTEYPTLAAAIEAANAGTGSTVTMYQNVKVSERFEISGTNITLDLNGMTIESDYGNDILYVKENASLTIEDNIGGGEMVSTANVSVIYNEGSLVIDGGTIKNTYSLSEISSSGIVNEGTLTVNDGKISANNSGVGVIGGIATINGGEIYSNMAVSVAPAMPGDSCELIVNGGNISGEVNGIYVSGENGDVAVTINGGSISGKYSAIDNVGHSETTINGGVLTGGMLVSSYEGVSLGDGIALYDENGKEVGFNNASDTAYAMPKGDYVVFVINGGSATGYESMDSAILAIGNNSGTIRLLKSYEIESGDIVIADGQTLIISPDATLTVADEAGLIIAGILLNNGVIVGDVTVANDGYCENLGSMESVTNNGEFFNYGIINDEINNSGVMTIDDESVIYCTINVNGVDSESTKLELINGQFPDGLTVSGTVGGNVVTIADILGDGKQLFNERHKGITLTEGQTSVAEYVYVYDEVFPEDMVAQVETADGTVEEFYSLEYAIETAVENQGSTVTLLKDITVNEAIYLYEGEFTLDLNGKTLTAGDELINYIIYVDGAKLTVASSMEGGTISSAGLAILMDSGTLNLGRGTIIEADHGIVINKSGTVNIKGGTINSEGCGITNYYGTFNIEDGSISGAMYNGIKNYYGTVVISGETLVETGSENYAAIENGAVVTIENGVFKGAKTIEVYENYMTGELGTVLIYGGEFPDGFVIEGTTAKEALAEGINFYAENGDIIRLTDAQTEINESVIAGIVEINSGTYNTEYGFTGKAIADPADYITTTASNMAFVWYDAEGNELEEIPSGAGTYKLKVIASLKNGIAEKTEEHTVTISYLKVKNGVEYTTDDSLTDKFVVKAADGYKLMAATWARSVNWDGEWSSELTCSKDGNGELSFYVKNVKTGVISDVVIETYTKNTDVTPGDTNITTENTDNNQGNNSGNGGVATGDLTNPLLWFVILMISGAGIVGLAYKKKEVSK